MANKSKKISELPSLSPASLDSTYVVGISGSTTYKISVSQLTSSLDTTFATDLVTTALSSSLDAKLSTSSFNQYTASVINTGSFATTGYVNNATGLIYNLLNSYQAINITGTGINIANPQSRNHSIILNITSGFNGNYSGSLVLPTGNRVNGDRISIHANYEASTRPDVQIYSSSFGANNLLFSWSGDGTATKILVDCLYTGLGYFMFDAHFLG